MTISRAAFIEEFAEFAKATNALVDARLAEAYRRTPANIWGDLVDDGAKYLAAHLMAQSPFAAELKLIDKNGETRYGRERERLEGIVACGPRIAGDTTPWLG